MSPESTLPTIADFFRLDSIWFFILQAVIWFAACGVMIWSLSRPHRPGDFSSLKTNLGLFLLFIVLMGGFVYVFFGRPPSTLA